MLSMLLIVRGVTIRPVMLLAFGSISSCPPYDFNVHAIQNVRYNVLDHFTWLVIIIVVIIVVVVVIGVGVVVIGVVVVVIFSLIPFSFITPSIMMV